MTEAKKSFFSLYEKLDKMQYILANKVESILDENYPLYEALSEYNQNYFDAITDDELKSDYGWDGDDRYSFIMDMDYPEIYQTFIVDEYSHKVLKDFGEITYYNEEMDLYFWGVTHYDTAWSHVMNSVYPVQNEDHYTKR